MVVTLLRPKKSDLPKVGRRPPKGIRRYIRRKKAEARRAKELAKAENSPTKAGQRERGHTQQRTRKYGEHHKSRRHKGVSQPKPSTSSYSTTSYSTTSTTTSSNSTSSSFGGFYGYGGGGWGGFDW